METHFEDVIMQVNDLKTVRSIITYLLGSKEGTIYMVPAFSEKDKKSTLRKLRSIVNKFDRQNPLVYRKNYCQSITAENLLQERI
ncbi:hypothetical protein LX73_1445 [Fodinibius salinus]|uniref:Uncharacterized protein n=1 Tax=Fodinibius salinus TaxID=860790 RepID=A0A5D3YJQ6_9BACT|nr:hypothetical protein LX73_1445 [Fodinibius salinus]